MGYRGKVAEQEQARELRAGGLTLLEIARELGVAKSSVSLWVRGVEFMPGPRVRARRCGPNALQRRKQAEIDSLIAEGRERIGVMSDRDLLVAGAALYAGEGSKADGPVVFANSDPRMMAFFCAWLRRFFDVDESRLRVTVYLHQGLDIDAAVAHWTTVTGIAPSQFNKPYRAIPDPAIRRNKHEFGCAYVRYSCSRTHRAVMGLVQALLASGAQ
jgi:hypothetical protein